MWRLYCEVQDTIMAVCKFVDKDGNQCQKQNNKGLNRHQCWRLYGMCGKHAVLSHPDDYDRGTVLRYSEHRVTPRISHYKISPKCRPEIVLTVKLYSGSSTKFKLDCNICRNCYTIYPYDERISFEPFLGIKKWDVNIQTVSIEPTSQTGQLVGNFNIAEFMQKHLN